MQDAKRAHDFWRKIVAPEFGKSAEDVKNPDKILKIACGGK